MKVKLDDIIMMIERTKLCCPYAMTYVDKSFLTKYQEEFKEKLLKKLNKLKRGIK